MTLCVDYSKQLKKREGGFALQNLDEKVVFLNRLSIYWGLYGLVLFVFIYGGYRFIKSQSFNRITGAYIKALRIDPKDDAEVTGAIAVPIILISILILFGTPWIIDLILKGL
jgi:hypothetical protein